MMRVVHEIIIQIYIKNADGVIQNINSLSEKNSHDNYNVKKVYTNKLHDWE